MAETKEKNVDPTPTERLPSLKQKSQSLVSRPLNKVDAPIVINTAGKQVIPAMPISKHEVIHAQALRERFRQLGLAFFADRRVSIRSLGFTSTIEGEGKSFLSSLLAQVLADDGFARVTLLDCNWRHTNLHEHFDIPATPGLAEWLRGDCKPEAIRYSVNKNLTIIPAGNGHSDAISLLQEFKNKSFQHILTNPEELLIVDLPAVLSTGYGALAASLPEALLFVVRAGVTPAPMIEEAFGQLTDLPVKSVVLNQVESKIPRWIRQLL